jgi:hypothetical protein
MKVKSESASPLWKIQTGGLKPSAPVVSLPTIKRIADFFKEPASHAEYKATLRGLPDAMLKAEQARLEQRVLDASAGPAKDEKAAERARAQLAEVKEELAARDGFSTSRDPAYAREMHRKPAAEVQAEVARQTERLKEASTGLSTDPAAAADAKEKLAMLQKELFGRVMDAFQGKLPEDPPSEKLGVLSKLAYGFSVGTMDAPALAGERARQEGLLRDASSGAHQDPIAAANAREKLEMISRREAQLGAQPQSVEAYRAELRGKTDGQLEAERARLTALRNDAGFGHVDLEATRQAEAKLKEVESELALRQQLAAGPQPEFATSMHGKSDAEVRTEVARQQERLREASTGLAQDPVAARDATEKLQVLMREQLRRFGSHFAGNLPVDPPTRPVSDKALKDFGVQVRDDSPEQLVLTREMLEREVVDSAHGPHVDPARAENARKKLEVLQKEEALRAELARGPQPAYALQVHGSSDGANFVELMRQRERLREASTGSFTDPVAARDAAEKIKALEAEASRRNPLDVLMPLKRLAIAG